MIKILTTYAIQISAVIKATLELPLKVSLGDRAVTSSAINISIKTKIQFEIKRCYFVQSIEEAGMKCIDFVDA